MIKRWICAVLASLAWLLPPGAATAQAPAATAEELMKQSGAWGQLADTAGQVYAGFQAALANGGARLEARDEQRMRALFDEAYGADRLRGAVRALLAEQLDPAHLPALTAWYASPLGRRITALEEQASAGDMTSDAALRQGVAVFEAAAPQRRELLLKMVQATRMAESTANIAINTALGIQLGLASARPELPAPPRQELLAQLETQRPQMVQAFTGWSLALLARVYEPLGDTELAPYLAFMQSPAGAHFTLISMDALDRSLSRASTAVGERLPAVRPAANS